MILASSTPFIWAFVTRHPGIMLVLLGVVGEVVFDWKEMGGKSGRGKKLSAILIIVGLLMEFGEAAKSDREVADTKERTALIESTNVVLSLRVEELRSTNLVLSTRLEELRNKQNSRAVQLRRSGFVDFLKGKPTATYVILYIPDDAEAREFAFELGNELSQGGWFGLSPQKIPTNMVAEEYQHGSHHEYVQTLTLQELAGGTSWPISLRFLSRPEDPTPTSAGALIDALGRAGFNELGSVPDPSLPAERIVVIIGKKP